VEEIDNSEWADFSRWSKRKLTSDKTTLRPFLEKIEQQYGKANRTWVMDRGIPTEEVLREMREASSPVSYLAKTPRSFGTTIFS